MGTTSEKLTYLNTTKQKLKQAINNIGGEVTDETTFRQYANQLQNVYDNLPKTEYQEGTEINLGVTSKGKLDYENGVVGIGQSSQESTQGYNLFKVIDYTTISSLVANAGGTISKSKDKIVITTTTQSASGAYIYKSFLSNLILNYDATKTYYLSADVTFSTTTNFKFGKDSSSFNNYTQGKYHLEESIQDNSIVFYTNGTASTITIENIMFCETANKTYEPYTGGQASPNPSYPQTINSVTGNQDVVVKDGDNNTIVTYQLSLGDIELCGIGNYKDELIYDVDEDKVYKNKAINKKIIDGTEGWQDSGITSVAYTNIITDYATSNNIPYCTHFKGENNCNGAGGMQDYGDNSIAFMQVSGSITPRLYIKKIGMTTLQLRTLLAEIKPILYYALETEVKEEITGTLKDQIKALYNAHSNNGTTIITSNGDLPMIIKVRGLKGE